MKIREGFVSNSSSSSFILGLGRITDRKKFEDTVEKYLGDHYFRQYCAKIQTVGEIIAQSNDSWARPCLTHAKTAITLDAGYGSAMINLPLMPNESPETLIAIIDIHNHEGDFDKTLTDAVYEGEELDEEYFDENQRVFLALNEQDHGVTGYRAAYGAGRDG